MKRYVLGAMLLLMSFSSMACSCVDYTMYLRETSAADWKWLDSKNVVVFHGRVKEVGADAKKEIDVTRWISGAQIPRVWAKEGPAAACGTSFVTGEEQVFVAYSSVVSACGKLPPTKELIQALVSHANSMRKNATERTQETGGENVVRATIVIESGKKKDL